MSRFRLGRFVGRDGPTLAPLILATCLCALAITGATSASAQASCTPAEEHSTAGTGLTEAELRSFVEDAQDVVGMDDCAVNDVLDNPDLIDAVPTEVEEGALGSDDTDIPSEVSELHGFRPLVNCWWTGVYTTYKNIVGQILIRYSLTSEWCSKSGRILSAFAHTETSIGTIASKLWRDRGSLESSDRYLWWRGNARGQFVSFRKQQFESCIPVIDRCLDEWTPSLLLYVRANGTRTGYPNPARGSTAPGGGEPDPGPGLGAPYEPPGTPAPPIVAPTASTSSASGVAQHSATFNGSVNPNGSDTTYHFEYGRTTSYGSYMPVGEGASAGAGTSGTSVSQTVSELVPETTYHYRLVATNQAGVTHGADQTLRTPAPSFTGDGKADLILADPANNVFSVATSTGSALGGPGTQQWLIGWDTSPEWARTGDFNGDGKDDVIMADPVAGTYTVALSSGTHHGAAGSGTWLTGWGGRPDWAEVGDFNGDGRDDLIANDPSAGAIVVALSDGRSLRAAGTGTWMTAWGGARPTWADVGDFNGDGKDDFITADPANGTYAVALSDGRQLNGSGWWLTGWGGNPQWARTGDFTGDGKDDLIVGFPGNWYAVAVSDGRTLRGPGTQGWLFGWGSDPAAGQVADFNGDGKDDLLVESGPSSYAVATSTGSALGGPGTQQWLSGWFGHDTWTGAGDFTGDGKADLIAADPASNSYAVSTSTGSALGGPGSQQWLWGWDTSPDWARAGDFDGDGKTDVITADPIAGTYTVALSSGSHLGAAGSGTWLTGWGGRPDWAEVGDFNGDGRDDLIANDPSAGSIVVALSDGRSLRAPGSGTWMTAWGGARPTWADVGDFNGDGKDDLILTNPVLDTYVVALSTGFTLGAPGTMTWLTGWSGSPVWARAGDVTGDGKDDLMGTDSVLDTYVVATSTGAQLGGAGSGTWLTGWSGTPVFADVADFDGDGHDDLIASAGRDNWYAVALSTGTTLVGGRWLTGWNGTPPWAAAG